MEGKIVIKLGTFTKDNLLNAVEQGENIQAAKDAVVQAARGLSYGVDWNNGTHVKEHGYRQKLLGALSALDAAEGES